MPGPNDVELHGEAGFKVFEPEVRKVIGRSVDSPADISVAGFGGSQGNGSNVLFFASAFNDGIPKWGSNVVLRDIKLREFIVEESYAASAFGSIIAKYASAGWEITGPKKTRLAAHKLLHQANWGAGWENFLSKFTWDLLTQDKGAFVELTRAQDSPSSPVIGFRTLDSQHCWPTGNPETPVIFYNRQTGKYHKLKWWHVWHQLELPINHAVYTDIQLCALSRALAGARIFKNVTTYIEEKTGGRHSRAIHVLSGVGREDIADALKLQQAESDNQLLTRYIQPTILTILDPAARASVATLELASLPEGFSSSEHLKDYFMLLALSLGTDYGELAPLPGKAIGSGSESEVNDKKSERKGSGLFRKLVEHFINYVVLPDNVHFKFEQTDLDASGKEATNKKTRAEARSIMVLNQEIDGAGARQLALDDGDISIELFLAMNERDITENESEDEDSFGMDTPGGGTGTANPKAPVAAVAGGAGGAGNAGGDTGNGTNKTDFPRRLQTNKPRRMSRQRPMTPMQMTQGKVSDSQKIS